MAPLAPALVAAASLASIAGGFSAIMSGLQQAQAEKEAGRYNAALAVQEAAVGEERLRRDRERRLSSLRAAIGGRGVQLSGSPLAILADQAAEAEEEALLVRFGGRQRAQAIQFGAQGAASLARSQGLAQGILAFGAAGTTLLGGIQAGAFAGGGGGLGGRGPGADIPGFRDFGAAFRGP